MNREQRLATLIEIIDYLHDNYALEEMDGSSSNNLESTLLSDEEALETVVHISVNSRKIIKIAVVYLTAISVSASLFNWDLDAFAEVFRTMWDAVMQIKMLVYGGNR